MKLEDIGFYTLSDKRAKEVTPVSQLKRCEILLTDKCNFKCPYCRGVREDCKGEIPLEKVKSIIDIWAKDNLENIRFSGGEPTLYSNFIEVVRYAKEKGIKRVAISTNGSADRDYYVKLWLAGVYDFSISLDACCALLGNKMTGNVKIWDKVTSNIQELSRMAYVTVGIVFTEENANQVTEIIRFADRLDVADIRILSSAQYNKAIKNLDKLSDRYKQENPILRYRINNFANGRNVRGIKETDNHQCPLVLDDIAVAGNYHFPCIIYLREQGEPIGKINPNMRAERYKWFLKHNSYFDKICRNNCLDVCIDHNNKCRDFKDA